LGPSLPETLKCTKMHFLYEEKRDSLVEFIPEAKYFTLAEQLKKRYSKKYGISIAVCT
jgi:hypothetical protein